MATAGFAAAPGMSTAEQDGTSMVHQAITCHYYVYAPTTVHINSRESRCVTGSSSNSATENTPRSSITQGPVPTDKTSLKEVTLEIGEALRSTEAGGKSEAILRWLIIKLTLLFEKVSSQEKCVVTVCQGRA